MKLEILHNAIKRTQEVISGLIMSKGEVESDFVFIETSELKSIAEKTGFGYMVKTGFGSMALFMAEDDAMRFASRVVGLTPEEVSREEALDVLKEFCNQFFGMVTLDLAKISNEYSIRETEVRENTKVKDLLDSGLVNAFNLKFITDEGEYQGIFLMDDGLRKSLEGDGVSVEDLVVTSDVGFKDQVSIKSDARATVRQEQTKLEMILDVELPLYARLGKTRMKIKDILKLAPGSIIELDKSADDYVELVVNRKVIALGDIVVVESNFGFRIKEIVSRSERISGLRS